MIAYLCLFSASLVLAEYCQFPADHPIQDLESGDTVRVQILDSRRVYIYTDSFDDCRGCVRSIKFCYSAGIGDNVELMTILVGNDPRESHRVIVNSTHDRGNCGQRYSLGLGDCCVEQILTESFVISSQSRHYALRIRNPPASPLRHQSKTVAGEIVDLNGNPILEPVYQPLFYFVIDPSDGMSSVSLFIMACDNVEFSLR